MALKITVYAIAKNEEGFAARWAESTRAADYRVVCDTGSTDRTVERLESFGVTVHPLHVEPWRFDVARNQSLALVPEDSDVCIALDLDEVLLSGWREALEGSWKPETTLARYPFISHWEVPGIKPLELTYGFRIHARHKYYWKYAVHEVLRPFGEHVETRIENLWVHHYPDLHRKPGRYMHMLRDLVEIEPAESRYLMYYGIELFNSGEYEIARTQFERFLTCFPYADPGERAFVYRILAKGNKYLGSSMENVIGLLHQATACSPYEREPWVDLARAMADVKNWPNCFSASLNAVRIKDQFRSYRIDPSAWDGTAERLLETSAVHLSIPSNRLTELRAELPGS